MCNVLDYYHCSFRSGNLSFWQELTAMASAAIAISTQIASKIFGGMAQRAAEATNENANTQQAIQSFDQALSQINQAYNSGNMSQNDALVEVAAVWQYFWQVTTPKIQPNRNGCASGSNCPSSAPANYCSGNIGGTCCVGCTSLKIGIENVTKALTAGSGTANIPKVYGSHYGVLTRPAYTLTFTKPQTSNVLASANSAVNGLLSDLGLIPSTVSGVAVQSTSHLGIFAAIGIGAFLLVMVIKK
jgi:hypothetical protein